MFEGIDGLPTVLLAQDAGVDTTGVALAVVVVLVAAGLLLWHIQQVKKRPATSYDKLVGGLWAAVIVLAIGRALSLLL